MSSHITLHQNGKTRQMVHNGSNQWSLAPGSQGIINPPALEETAHRLGELTAVRLDRAQYDRTWTKFGSNTNNLQITVELKNGAKNTVDFGRDLPQDQTALAAVTLDGERWAFVFPPVLYQFVLSYLTIPAQRSVMRHPSGFWRKCRVGFRWLRIAFLLAVLALVCAFVWFNRIGLPDFVKRPLVEKLHARGVELEFTRLRLRFVRGLVAENVRLGHGAAPDSPVLTLAEIQLRLDHRALLHRRLQINSLVLREGKLVWPLTPTNALVLNRIQTDLRFQTNDTWSLDHFQAAFAGAKLSLAAEIAHAPEIRHWEMFHGKGTGLQGAVRTQLKNLSDTLDRIHFEGVPQLSLVVNGDARDIHTFVVRLDAQAPAVQTPWGGARDLQLAAHLSAPADAPTNFDSAWGWWTNLQPYRLAWTMQLTQLQSEKLNADSVACGGLWQAPELAVTNLSAALGGGQLDAQCPVERSHARVHVHQHFVF